MSVVVNISHVVFRVNHDFKKLAIPYKVTKISGKIH